MSSAPFQPRTDATIKTASGQVETVSFVAHYQAADPAAAATDAIHDAVTDDGTEQTITTGITNPDFPRAITATAGGTAADIKAIQVTINGTDASGATITEDLPAFTENTAGTVTGSKAFASVSSIVQPAMDGTGATVSYGTADKLGLNHKLNRNTVISSHLNGSLEGTAATVAVSSTVLASNTVDLNSALDGNQVDVYYLVDATE